MTQSPAWNEVLRALREARGVSQEGWATRLGYSRRTLQRWEEGVSVPDAAAEAALLTVCGEQGLFRAYDRGPLAGLTVTAPWLQQELATARLAAAAPADRPPPATRGSVGPPSSLPPLRTLPHHPTNLPRQLTSFIGREHELAAITALLGTTRLLTLTGPGGSGKTRLALAVAAAMLDAFPDGVWFVDLSGVTDPAGVVPAIAQVLGVRESAGRSLVVSLAAYLRSKHLLLLLDNFEQVVEAALVLHHLLVDAPRLTALVTSRTQLRVEGEQEYAVAPLPLPAASASASLQPLHDNPAVALFIARAQALRPDFALTTTNAASVAALCRRLDGLPLAIELAAARVKLLPPDALLARLDRRLPLLTGGARTAPARQQTLRATIQWSWDLLPPHEQVLFRRLGIFAGGWTVAAADAVCNADGALDLLDGLASLVDQSLVGQRGLAGEPRFTMLATLREFALEQLDAGGEAAAVRRRHAEYYTALVEAAHTAFWPSGRVRQHLLEPLDPEWDNLAAALDWAVSRPDVTRGLRLAGGLDIWFYVRLPGEGRRWLDRMLALPRAEGQPHARGVALYGAAACTVALGEPLATAAYLEEAVPLLRQVDDLPALSRTLALLAGNLPDAEAARALTVSEQAVTVARTSGDVHALAYAEICAGIVRTSHGGDLEQARRHLEEGLRLARTLGADWVTTHAVAYLAEALRVEGQPAAARRLWQEARPLAEALGDRFATALAVVCLALVASTDQDWAQAAVEWCRGLVVARELGSIPFAVISLAGSAGVLTAWGQPERGARLLGAVDAAWQGRDREGFAYYQRLYHDAAEPARALTRAALSPEAFAAAQTESETLSLEQATDLALAALSGLAAAHAVPASGGETYQEWMQ